MTKKEFEENKTKDGVLKILCVRCKNNTKHSVLSSINESGTEPWDSTHDFHWETDYEIIQCLGCETVSFRENSINSEHDDHEGRPIPTTRIYPKRSNDTLAQKNFFNVPFSIQGIYRETIDSYNFGSYILCCAGIRAIIEGLCKENNITGGNVEYPKDDGTVDVRRKTNLQGKINGLHENGIITENNAVTLHQHRFMGNEALHELSLPARVNLKLAIDIIENTLESVYELPFKGKKLKENRERE